MKYVLIVKQNVKSGIVVTHYKDLTVIKCCDYISKEGFIGYERKLDRTAKQLKPLMNFTQEY